jgi:hypothetical protein
MRGRARAALDHVEQAIDLDPFDNAMRFHRARTLTSLGNYEAVRDAARECVDRCVDVSHIWFLALCGFASPEQYRQDFPAIVAAARIPAEFLLETRGIAEAFVLGRPYSPPKLEDPRDIRFSSAAIAARLIGFDEGLRYARSAAAHHQADDVVDILNEGRVTFTPEQRADPRYHELFRHPKLINIAKARREEGVTAGLPVFPVKPYTGR